MNLQPAESLSLDMAVKLNSTADWQLHKQLHSGCLTWITWLLYYTERMCWTTRYRWNLQNNLELNKMTEEYLFLPTQWHASVEIVLHGTFILYALHAVLWGSFAYVSCKVIPSCLMTFVIEYKTYCHWIHIYTFITLLQQFLILEMLHELWPAFCVSTLYYSESWDMTMIRCST